MTCHTKTLTLELPAWNAVVAQSYLEALFKYLRFKFKNTPIHHALDVALLGHALDCGATFTEQHLIFACDEAPELIEMILSHGVIPNDMCLTHALNSSEITELFIEAGAPISNYHLEKGLAGQNEAIMKRMAVMSTNKQAEIATGAMEYAFSLEKIRNLVEQWGAVPMGSVLFDFCERKYDDIACYLVEQGADYLYKQRDDGWSARTWAKRYGLTKTVDAIAKRERTQKFQQRLERQAKRTRKKMVEQTVERRAM